MVVVAILAAGTGQRFGSDKTAILLGGKPLWRWSFDLFASHPRVDRILLVGSPGNIRELSQAGEAILGGATRQDSALEAARQCDPDDVLLVHDAARPFVTSESVNRVLDALSSVEAAAPGVPVTDTIKERGASGIRTLDRSRLVAMQTPQGVRRAARLIEAAGHADATDELSVIESMGLAVDVVEGDDQNFKVTRPIDLERARSFLGGTEMRTGIGYDIHAFSDDPSRELWIGGVSFEGHRALDGHSDADVLLHAVTDAVLGAVAMGDIGQHFPNTDPRWAGEPSTTFLTVAAVMVGAEGWSIVNVDATVIAESPKVMQRADAIRAAIAAGLGIQPDRVSVKATTNERLGSIGRSEGIAAFAIATLQR